jgi:inorganic triphosphatase YgiF
MTEIELKLQVPAAALPGVERALAAAPATTERLRALYYDTPDGRLAAAGVALRLRQEGRSWVQTLKSGPAHGLSRGEHEVAVDSGPGGAPPTLDLGRHAGTPPGAALAAALSGGDRREAPGKACRKSASGAGAGEVALAGVEGEATRTGGAARRVLAADGPPAAPARAQREAAPADPGAQAMRACAIGEAALAPRYRTDVQRRRRLQRTRRGTVELALDVGEITAVGPDGVERRWPVCELEIELKSGAASAVVDVARRWAARHGLWLDTRSKAERGERLARGLAPGAQVPAVKARPSAWHRTMRPAEAWARLLDDTLAHALPNWSEVAAGSRSHDAVHQLRVALRRLRSAERLFEGWPGVPALGCRDGVTELFRRLGATRDRDVLQAGLAREIDAALADLDAPPLALPASAAVEPDDASRTRDGLLMIDLMAERLALEEGGALGGANARRDGAGFAGGPDDAGRPAVGARRGARPEAAGPDGDPPDADGVALRARVAERLERWHRQVRRDARRFAALDDTARHRLRKRLKRLRYGVEFGAGLFGRRAVGRYLERLQKSQDGLGLYNDTAIAQAAYGELRGHEPRAWFALGWLDRRRASEAERCADELRRLRKAKPFWR